MNTTKLEKEFRDKICDQIRLVPHGIGRFLIHQPFTFDDGDHFVVVLKEEAGSRWVLSDEGNTLMHIQYDDIDLSSKTRCAIFEDTLNAFSVTNREGEIRLQVPEKRFGDALYSFLQALNKISDLSFIRRERVRTAFFDDVQRMMEEIIPDTRRIFNYHDPERDPDGNYKVDLRINGMKKPELVFFIPNDSRCTFATITCLKFENWNIPFRATGIYEDQTKINRRAVAQFSDIANKQWSSIGAKDRIRTYFEELLQGNI